MTTSRERRMSKRYKARIKALKSLVRHCWVHNGSIDCGLLQMTNEQKVLYLRTIGRPRREWPEWLLERVKGEQIG